MLAVTQPNTFEPLAAILLEHLPQSLAVMEARLHLWRCASLLPPIPRGGFEYRLDGSSEQVDFHLFIRRDEIALTRAFLSQQKGKPFDHPVWQRTATFLAQWENGSSGPIDAFFLEFDGATDDSAAILPSLFTGFDPNHRTENYATALQTLAILKGLDGSPSAAFQRCFEVDSPTWVSHLGVMLARPQTPYRLNIQLQSWEQCLPTLRQIEWRGDFDTLSRLLAWLPDYIHRCTLAVDVDTSIYPHIGLELFLPTGAQLAEDANCFLTALAARGLCTPNKRAGMLEGLKWLTPFNTKTQWPDELILQDLRQPGRPFIVPVLRPGHVKLTIYPNGKISAKGYHYFKL